MSSQFKAAAPWKIEEALYEGLRDSSYAAAYVNEALLEGDEAFLKTATADVIRARGVGKVAKLVGVNRVTIFKILKLETRTSFTTYSEPAFTRRTDGEVCGIDRLCFARCGRYLSRSDTTDSDKRICGRAVSVCVDCRGSAAEISGELAGCCVLIDGTVSVPVVCAIEITASMPDD